MKKLILFAFVLTIAVSGFSKKKENPYHTVGTEQYNNVTAKIIGDWNIASFDMKGTEKIGVVYD